MIQLFHLGINLKKTKTLTGKDICTPMFITALYTTAKVWKQPVLDEWIKMMWEMYVME